MFVLIGNVDRVILRFSSGLAQFTGEFQDPDPRPSLVNRVWKGEEKRNQMWKNRDISPGSNRIFYKQRGSGPPSVSDALMAEIKEKLIPTSPHQR